MNTLREYNKAGSLGRTLFGAGTLNDLGQKRFTATQRGPSCVCVRVEVHALVLRRLSRLTPMKIRLVRL
jgi:hypothetical protein